MRTTGFFLALLLVSAVPPASNRAAAGDLPVRAIHFSAPRHGEVSLCEGFIRNELNEEGVNVLVLEINYGFEYQSHPELSGNGALTRDDMGALAAACRESGIELIPMINCLGHQSWAKTTFSLLREYPEFDETPGKYPENEGIYCRSYCPLHPDVHDVIFSLMDELIEAADAKSFHVGLDEVFILGDGDCPRCAGRDRAELFAHEVNTLHGHLSSKGVTMWMWGDRFLDGETTGIGKWEASMNGTAPAADRVSKDIVICDWHYEKPHPTAPHFALMGFNVVSSPWRKPHVALGQLELTRFARRHSSEKAAQRMRGMLHTTWCGFVSFIRAYRGEETDNRAAAESAETFKILFEALREAE